MMRRVQAEEPGAFALLVERYQAPVLNTVFKYVGNRAISEELAQDVFVRIYRARKTYEQTARFDTWLYRIVFNLCVNATEYGKRRRALSLDADGRQEEDDGPRIAVDDRNAATPLEQMEKRELQEQVRLAIARLPGQQKAALIMSRYQGMPYQEIAESLETSVEAIKSLLFRARENLRQLLAAYVQEEAPAPTSETQLDVQTDGR